MHAAAFEGVAHRPARSIVGVLALLAVVGWPATTMGDRIPDTDPITSCIEECANAYPDLGDEYDECVAACYEE